MQQFLELLDDRVLPGFDAASTALCIMTADEMPKEVFVEDTIEWIVKIVKWHLLAIIYPHASMFKGLSGIGVRTVFSISILLSRKQLEVLFR